MYEGIRLVVELLWKGIVHYRRPNTHSDIEEWKKVIEYQKKTYGKSLYEIRGVVENT